MGERVARFRVPARIDGQSECTVEIRTTPSGNAVVGVRPLRSRIEYTGMLSDVAEIVAARHAKALAAQAGIVVPRPRKR